MGATALIKFIFTSAQAGAHSLLGLGHIRPWPWFEIHYLSMNGFFDLCCRKPFKSRWKSTKYTIVTEVIKLAFARWPYPNFATKQLDWGWSGSWGGGVPGGGKSGVFRITSATDGIGITYLYTENPRHASTNSILPASSATNCKSHHQVVRRKVKCVCLSVYFRCCYAKDCDC